MNIIDYRDLLAIDDLGERSRRIKQLGPISAIMRQDSRGAKMASGLAIDADLQTHRGLTADLLDRAAAMLSGDVMMVEVCLATSRDKVQWWPAERRYLVIKDNMPVWESRNGVVCGDEAALADSLC